MTAPARLLPDAALLVLEVLRAAHIDAVDEMPRAGAMRYPLTYARRIPGSGPIHPQFLDSATVSVLTFARTRSAALNLAASASVALYDAWRNQTIYPAGSIASFEDMSGQTPLPGAPDSTPDPEVVVQATYRLGMCPPLTLT